MFKNDYTRLYIQLESILPRMILLGNLNALGTAKHFCVSQVAMYLLQLELQLLPGRQIPLNSRFAKFVKVQPSKQKLMEIGLQASLRANS